MPSTNSSLESSRESRVVSIDEAVGFLEHGLPSGEVDLLVEPSDAGVAAARHANELAREFFASLRPAKIPILDEELPYCNDNCMHCGVADIMKTANMMSLEDVRRHVMALAPHANRRVMFAVSELTIRPDFLEIVRSCRDHGFTTVAIVTNGRRFSYAPFAEETCASGATHFLVSIYGHNARIHQALTRTPESFEQTVEGIRNLLKVGGKVMTNTVITRRNADALPDIVRFLADLGVKRSCLSFVQIIGNAARYADRLIPRMNDVVASVEEAVRVGRELGLVMGVGGMPYCVLPGHEDCFGVDDLTYVFNGDPGDQITERSPYEMSPVCETCRYNAVCLGAQEEYLHRFGDGELSPVPGPRLTRRPESALGRDFFPDLFTS